MKRYSILLTTVFFLYGVQIPGAWGQKSVIKDITQSITLAETKGHVTFLAADEMRGRDTGTPEIEIAANYIATFFQQHNVMPGANGSYFQSFDLLRQTPPLLLELTINDATYHIKEDLLQFTGDNLDTEAEMVFVGYGTEEDLSKISVDGKIAVALIGLPSDPNLVGALLQHSPEKAIRIRKAGAIALIEMITTPGVPFAALANYLHGDRMILEDGGGGPFPHMWMKGNTSMVEQLKGNAVKGSLKVQGNSISSMKARNVAGVVQGKDPVLKNEYVIVSAHYDHVGIGKKDAQGDSIYNGARDNALGTVGMMMTAKYLAKNPPKRSILFLALAAEEKGLLGSEWYSNNPLVPLEKTVFNFNCDGAGYNDVTRASVMGLDHINSTDFLQKACETFGLALGGDVAPEQNLYERSDNFSFARKGVPAINFSPGVKAFDQDLMKYYHQPADDVNTLDFDYLIKFFRAYVYANVVLTNGKPPYWKDGNKFEPIGNELYGR